MAKAIVCQGLTRTYGKVNALDALDLEVEQGSVFGYLGRNGAGKTTTIRLLTGLAHPTKGDAWVNGIQVTGGDERARAQFGYLPEVPAFYTWMTPLEYLHYIGQLFDIDSKERKQRVDELLEISGLQKAAKRRIGGFSRGMRQRLGLAQAMINHPPVLFLDEPTSALDPAGRKSVLDMIDNMRRKTTIFLSSHILADIERVCDTIAIIHEGNLILVSDRDELMSRYQSNTIELESDLFEIEEDGPFLTALRNQTWVAEIELLGKIIKVMVNDPKQAKEQMLKMIVNYELTVDRYEWIRPSLEEVFLDISS
jgi:ABC-2 type transport system ATP-binding protein